MCVCVSECVCVCVGGGVGVGGKEEASGHPFPHIKDSLFCLS